MRFVTWIWKGNRHYEPEHVNHLYRQLERVCPGRFSLVAVTDDTSGFLPGVEVIETPPAAKAMDRFQTPEKASFPSCYRRLWMFSEEAKALGERVMLIDVDLVFTADPSKLFHVSHDFVGWRPMRTWGTETRIGGGIYLLRTGTRTKVWTDFKGQQSINLARQAGLRGSDQAWLSYCLAKTEPTWPQRSGIYSVRDLTFGMPPPRMVRGPRGRIVTRGGKPMDLPADAMIVQFNGPNKSWDAETRLLHPWLNNCYERSDNAKFAHG